MEKLNFFKNIVETWTNLEPAKKVSYITAGIIIFLASTIIHYERKVTRMENEYKVSTDKLVNRYDLLLNASEERTRLCNENFNKYLERNEKEVREILFKYEEYRKKVNK